MVSCNYSLIPSFDFEKAFFIYGEACAVQTNKNILIGEKRTQLIYTEQLTEAKKKDGNKRNGFKEVLQHINLHFFIVINLQLWFFILTL